MRKKLLVPLFLGLIIHSQAQFEIRNPSRAEELKTRFWTNSGDDFKQTEIPDKWKNEQAVIIAKSNELRYKKEVLSPNLSYSRYRHVRVKLLDKSAVERFSQFEIPDHFALYGTRSTSYAGFKVIKPNGNEKEISLEKAVKQERNVGRMKLHEYKLAIPNLEIGDILDYYIGEDRGINLYGTKLYTFDPVIFQLSGTYPIVTQQISFEVLRRCFINVKTLNGAPSFETKTNDNDKAVYTLTDKDRESVDDVRWLYRNRELPTVKFRVTYANIVAASSSPFLKEPGQLNENITKSQIEKVLYNTMTYTTNTWSLNAYMRRHYKKETDLDKLAKAAYYVYRNRAIIQKREVKELRQDVEPVNYSYNGVVTLSRYYKKKKIPHQILIYVPRSISTIDDVIMENELALAIKVNTPNPFYLGKFTRYSNAGDMDEEMQGADAYAVDGLAYSGEWQLVNTDIPVVPHTKNKTHTHININIDDPAAEKQSIKVTKQIQGNSSHFSKAILLDIYDYLDEERADYEMAPSFENYMGKVRRQLEAKKTEYLDGKEKRDLEFLETYTKGEYTFDVEDVKNYKVVKTGRHHEDSALEYRFEFSTDGLISKAGANYLLDVGKLIEEEVDLSEDEIEREFNIYQNYPRTYHHTISINLPDDHEIRGIEKLNRAVENETGGFISSATLENNELNVDILKYYTNNYFPKEKWPDIVAFVREAHDFTHAKLLMKKK